ncbi:MAG TPA: tRNA glutamyl-Q(34) synthetase GluQRS [Edaphobacter sp.]
MSSGHGYRGRLAPSPTGLLHLGHVSTFRVAQTRAAAAGGVLLLRNEDLDPQRSKVEFVEAMIEDLAWLGIAWEPPMVSQSQREGIYQTAFEQLLEAGFVYPCRCSRKDLARMMHAPHEDVDDEPVYDGRCRPAGESLLRSLVPGVNYRFRVPDGDTVRFVDGNVGVQSFTVGVDFGDFLVWRKDGLPSYQLACVVDDAAMGITEIVRGADLLKSTARQMLLQRALGLPAVDYFHTRLMVDEHGVRLAKRHDALAIRPLRQRGLSREDVLGMLG